VGVKFHCSIIPSSIVHRSSFIITSAPFVPRAKIARTHARSSVRLPATDPAGSTTVATVAQPLAPLLLKHRSASSRACVQRATMSTVNPPHPHQPGSSDQGLASGSFKEQAACLRTGNWLLPICKSPSRFTRTLRVLHAGRPPRNIDFLLRSHLLLCWNQDNVACKLQRQRSLRTGLTSSSARAGMRLALSVFVEPHKVES